MSIELNGTTGITTPGLTNTGTETIVNLTTTGNTILGNASTDTLNVGNGDLVKDASGTLTVNCSSAVANALVVQRNGGTDTNTVIQFKGATTSYYIGRKTDGSLGFAYNTGDVTGSSAMTLDASGNLGIGTNTADARLDVRGSGNTTIDSKGNLFVSSGGTAAQLINTGGQISFGSWLAGDLSAPYIMASIKGVTESTTINSNAGALLFGVRDQNSLVERMRINSSGNLTITGATATKASGTTWANPSDIRLKDNVTDYSKGLAELMQVNVKEWTYNGKGNTTEGMKGLGVIADEVMEVLPNTVDTYQAKLNADDETDTDIKKFDATEITWLMLNSIKEQQALITSLTARLEVLEAK